MGSTNECTLVIGHKRPDLDSIASAIGYAALLRVEGHDAQPARAGSVDEQSAWALQRFGFDAPLPLMDVAPSFGSVASREPPKPPTLALGEAIQLLSSVCRALPVVDAGGKPIALVDARICVQLLGRALASGQPPGTAAQSADHALRQPIVSAATGGNALETPVMFRADERVHERRSAIAGIDPDDYLVIDEDGHYVGVVSRSVALAPPRRRLVLVDHNEVGQAVAGTELADIAEVIDHHKLGNPATTVPIPFIVDVVGSTATLVEERWRLRSGPPPSALAGLLLSALLSDTLAFRSPTCTPRDRAAAARMAELAGIHDLAAFGEEVVTAGAGLGQRSGDDIVGEDYKDFTTSKGPIVVSQAEVKSLHEIGPRAADLGQALERLREKRGATLAVLLLTDPVRATSRLMAAGDGHLIARIPYARENDGLFDAPSVVSRKKQLVPALLAALEG